MLLMILGLVLFLGVHSLPIASGVRVRIKDSIGDIPYRIVFSLVSLGGLIAIAEGFKAWKYQEGSAFLYIPPPALSHVALLLMLFSFIALASMYGKSHIKKVLKHPMLVAIKIWALAHLLANGDAASVTLFGAFLVWAVVDRISVKRRERAGMATPVSFEPRVRDDIIALAVGIIVYVLFVWKVHLWLIGVAPVAMGGSPG
ncbi:MAG: NnrU family protein [Pseudomonadota bacterium]